MDGVPEPQNTPVVEPIEPTTVTPADTFDGLDDAALGVRIDELISEAEGIANPDAVEAFDTELFEAAFSRVAVARNELANRQTRRAAQADARDRAAQLAADRPARVPSVATIGQNLPAVPAETPAVSFRFVVPSDAHNLIDGRGQGSEFGSFAEIGQAMDRREQLVRSSVKGRSNPYGLMQIQRSDSEFSVSDATGPEAMASILDRVSSQKRLPGGDLIASWERSVKARAKGDMRRVSLTAAAGWCAPSETMYTLCEMETLAGVISLPEITVTRGGIRWTQNPTFAELMSANTFTSLTEAQVIADTAKACAEIPCPTFTDTRLNVAVTCLTGSFLQLRGYPELMARWGRGAMVAHAHKLNRQIIAAMVVQAGAVTPVILPADDAATSSVLSAAALAALDTRYREGLPDDAVIEQAFPLWVTEQIRADFARRNTGRPDVTNAEIMDWFATRNIRPYFVRDWQDFWSGVAAPSIGGPAPYIAALPNSVQFLSYPAGSVVLARQDVITLHNVYDSTNLAQNLYTDTFFEEGWALIYPCAGLRLYSTTTCPSGSTGAQVNWDCTP